MRWLRTLGPVRKQRVRFRFRKRRGPPEKDRRVTHDPMLFLVIL